MGIVHTCEDVHCTLQSALCDKCITPLITLKNGTFNLGLKLIFRHCNENSINKTYMTAF